MEKFEFTAVLQAFNGGGAGVYIPFDVEKIFGTRGQVKIKCMIEGHAYKGSIAAMGGGRHVLGVLKKIREAANKKPGDEIHIILARDTDERTVEIPEDLQKLLAENAIAQTNFQKFSYTSQKEYVRWITSTKKPETRQNRLEKAMEMISAGKKYS